MDCAQRAECKKICPELKKFLQYECRSHVSVGKAHTTSYGDMTALGDAISDGKNPD